MERIAEDEEVSLLEGPPTSTRRENPGVILSGAPALEMGRADHRHGRGQISPRQTPKFVSSRLNVALFVDGIVTSAPSVFPEQTTVTA